MWVGSRFHLDLWMNCACLRSPKPACNPNAIKSLASKGYPGTEGRVNRSLQIHGPSGRTLFCREDEMPCVGSRRSNTRVLLAQQWYLCSSVTQQSGGLGLQSPWNLFLEAVRRDASLHRALGPPAIPVPAQVVGDRT